MNCSEVTAYIQYSVQLSAKPINACCTLGGGMYVAGGDAKEIYLVDEKLVEKQKLPVRNKVHSICLDSKRQVVYVCGAWGTVDTFKFTNNELQKLNEFKWSSREIAHVIYDVDIDVVLATGFDGKLTAFDPQSKQTLYQVSICQSPVRWLTYDNVGGKLYCGTHAVGIPVFGYESPKQNQPQLLFKLAEGDELCHKGPVRAIVFDQQSRYMFSCDHAGLINVWHVGAAGQETKKKALGQLKVGSKLRTLTWMAQQKVLIAADVDGKCTCFNVGQSRQIGSFVLAPNEVMGVVAVNSGTQILSWAQDGKVILWNLNYKTL